MLKYELSSRTILLTLAAAVGWGSYQTLDIFQSDEQAARDRQGAALARQIALNLPLPEGRPRIIIAPFTGDDSQLLAGKCREWLARKNVRMQTPDAWDRLSSVLGETSPALDAATAVERYGSAAPEAYVVLGDVVEWATYPEQDARLTARIQLVNLENGATLHDHVFSVPDRQGYSSIGETLVAELSSGGESWGWRPFFWGFTAWIGLVFVAPWLSAGVIGPLLARESNLVNAGLLSVLVILATAAAWACWARGCSGDVRFLATVLAGAVSVPYLGYACGLMNELSR